MRLKTKAIYLIIIILLIGCAGDRGTNNRYIYTMSNDPGENQVYVFRHV